MKNLISNIINNIKENGLKYRLKDAKSEIYDYYVIYIDCIYNNDIKIIWNEEIQVANSKLNSILNMTSLSNGMYWLSIESNSKNIIKNEKIIINK
jgi:hypothetical protein